MSVPPFGYLRRNKLDFEVVKSKIGQLNEKTKTSYCVNLPRPTKFVPPSVSFPPFGYLRCFKSDFDVVKSKIGLIQL